MAKRESVVTMSDLQAVAGMRSRQAINAWIDGGLLPRPTIVRGRSGRGRRGVWPASVLERVRFICTRTDQGRTLADVLVELWEQDQPQRADVEQRVDRIVGRWISPGASRRGWKRGKGALPKGISVQDGWVAVIKLILTKDVGLSSATARRLARQAGDRAILKEVLLRYFIGFEPLLMISRGCVRVSTSATVGFDHSPYIEQVVKFVEGDSDEDHGVDGCITIQMAKPIEACLSATGDWEDPTQTTQLLLPATAVDGINFQSPNHTLRYWARPVLAKDGQIGVDLSSDRMFTRSPSAKAVLGFDTLTFRPEDAAKPSATQKNAPRPTRKAARRRG